MFFGKKRKKNVDLVCIFMFYTSEMIVDFSVMPLKKKKVCVLQLDSGMMFWGKKKHFLKLKPDLAVMPVIILG